MGRGLKTSASQRLTIVHWLQTKKNFDLVTGQAASGAVVAGTKLKKTDAYKDLAAVVNRNCNSEWDPQMAKSRYEAYVALFKKAKRASSQTGFGVSDIDKANGILTIADKLEKMCPYFKDMDELFGGRQNVDPVSVSYSAYGNNHDDDNFGDIEEQYDGEAEVAFDSPNIVVDNENTTVDTFQKEHTSRSFSIASDLSTPVSARPCAKRDFSALYLDAQETQMTIKHARLAHDKKVSDMDIELRRNEFELKREELRIKDKQINEEVRIKDKQISEETKRVLLVSLIDKGKTAQEAAEYLSALMM